MQTNIYRYLMALVVLLVTSRCNDLDLEPISEETTNTAYETASQLESALVGAYESLQSAEYYVWDNVLFQDVRSDNHYAGGDNPEIFSIDLLTISPTNSRLFNNWSNIYNAIAKTNLVLEKAAEVVDPQLTEDRRNEIMGEAYFLRAYHYYTLVNLWGGVPLLLETAKSADPVNTNIPRSTDVEVFSQILIDLDLAIGLLPDTYGATASVNKARATSGAANALAAKACAQKPTPEYNRVLSYIAAVEASAASYQLIDYSELFDGNNYNNAESIMEVQYLGGNEGNFGPQLLLPPSISGDSWRKFVTPSHSLIDAYNAENDMFRMNATVLFEEAPWVDEYWENSFGSSIPFGYKWKNADGWASSNRQYILRYGDIVLLKAEALNETDDLSGAVTEVNRIRSRVSLPDLSSEKTASKDALRQAIFDERRLELAQEAQRWDDLIRLGNIVATMNDLEEIDLRTGSTTTYEMTQAKILLPIPQQELDRNPTLTQNPL